MGEQHAWCASPAAHRLEHREFDDGIITFDPLTGGTSMLSPLCWFVLSEFLAAGETLDRGRLHQSLHEAAGPSSPQELDAMLDEALSSLTDAGLIQAACP